MQSTRGLLRFVVSVGLFAGTCGLLQAQTLSSLVAFNGPNGSTPNGTLMQADDGNFYGTTQEGGGGGKGTIFRMTPGGTETVMHSFTGSDGEFPTSGLIEGIDGSLYGVTFGGPDSSGTIFKIALDGTFTTLARLSSSTGPQNPCSALIQAADGTFYGVSKYVGGTNSGGSIYKVTAAGVVTVTYSFSESGKSILPSAVVMASDGYLYGTTVYGGTSDAGTLFRVATNGSGFAILHNFTGLLGDGSPAGGVVEGAAGVLFGVSNGLASLLDNVYSFTIGGAYAVLNSGTNLGSVGGLIAGTDGNLYALSSGIDSLMGGVYKITPAGDVVSLVSLGNLLNVNLNLGVLTLGVDGNLYGVSNSGGTGGLGFIFKVDLGGSLIPPINITLSEPTITLGNTLTLVWQLENGLSQTAQTCSAHGAWNGVQQPTGTVTVVPASAGNLVYALICDGVELGTVTVDVTKADSTTSVQSGPGSLQSGQTATFQLHVEGVNGGPTPTGTVTLNYQGRVLASGTLDANGNATVSHSTAGIPPGTYTVAVNYSGDLSYKSSSTDYTVHLTRAATATAISAPSSVVAGQSASLRATVTRTDGVGTPGGTVTFRYRTLVLGTANVGPNGTATLTASAAGIDAGTYSVQATYNGDGFDSTSQSATQTVVVTKSTSTLSLTSSATSVSAGETVTLTAAAHREYASKSPLGPVAFYAGNIYLGSAQLEGGKATFTRTSKGVSPGTYDVHAVWQGDTVSTGSSSNQVAIKVE